MANSVFDYEKHRLSYLELLRPNEGYEVTFAVCMTYSLDFDALIGGLISFDDIGDPNSGVAKEELYLLDAIQRNSSKVAVFCNSGSIRVPTRSPKLYHVLLENSIFEVRLEEKKSFHPKMWIVRYNNADNEPYINIVVLSRNLTFDSSLDIAIRFSGMEEEGHYNGKMQPLADMLEFVSNYSNDEIKFRITELTTQLLSVKKIEIDPVYDQVTFLPYGFNEYLETASAEYSGADEIVIVSPFLSWQTVNLLTEDAKKATLITRKYSVDKKIARALEKKGGVWILKDAMLDNSILEEGEDPALDRRDIHAKIIYEKKNNRSYLYVGSLNTSYRAFNRNIELMVKLRFAEGQMTYAKMIKNLLSTCEPIGEIDDYGVVEEVEDDDDLYDIICAAQNAYIVKTEKGLDVHVVFENIKRPAQIAMYSRNKNWLAIENEVVFQNVPLSEISSFYRIRRRIKGRDNEKIIIIRITNVPIDERNTSIIRSIVTPDKLIPYISILMADNYVLESKTVKGRKSGTPFKKGVNAESLSLAVYERLLRIAAIQPERLRYIIKQIKRIQRTEEPQEDVADILGLIETFDKAVKKKESHYGS